MSFCCGRFFFKTEHCPRCGQPEQPPEVPEPQEGASTKGVSAVDRTAPVGGAPSCDSAELSAARKLLFCMSNAAVMKPSVLWEVIGAGNALLHMVDELTNELKASRIATDEYSQASLRHRNQRDKLRTKLSEAAQRAANTVARADANEVRAQQLEVKLADSERQRLLDKMDADAAYSETYAALKAAEQKLTESERERGAWKERAQADMNVAQLFSQRAEAAEASLAAEEQRHRATERELLRQAEAAEARVARLREAGIAMVSPAEGALRHLSTEHGYDTYRKTWDPLREALTALQAALKETS